MSGLPPWANGPFELIVHAEGHLAKGEDFDRRIALISYDDSIEVSITTYLGLHPIQRGSRTYRKEDVEKWSVSYFSKLDFLESELVARTLPWRVDKGHIVWCHNHRNEQYHGGTKGTPEKSVLMLIRNAALWVFEVLFDVSDAEKILRQTIGEASPSPPQPDPRFNKAIDRQYGLIEVAGENYYTSELLFAVDETAYREIGTRLCETETTSEDDGVSKA